MFRVRLTWAVAALALAACQDAPTGLDQPTAPSLAKGQIPDPAAELAKLRPVLMQAVASRGGGNGVAFIQTTMTQGLFLFGPNGVCGADQVNRGNGSFYRQNPDGTVTVKLSDGRGSLFYADATTSYSGTGSFQLHATGQPFIFDTGIPGFIIVFVNPPYRGPWIARGVGRVVEDGTTGPGALLQCAMMLNPDGTPKQATISLQ